jgi:D-3-phosphoglycerate dehydrogenase
MNRAASRPVTLITETIDPTGIAALEKFSTVARPTQADEASILRDVEPANAIIVRVAPITAEVISAASNLQIIQKHGVGVDSIDVQCATSLGVPVCITAEANAASVSEFAVASTLALIKKLREHEQIVRGGGWRDAGVEGVHEIDGHTVGVIGGGRVGLRVLRAFVHGLGMRGLIYDPFVPEQVVRQAGGSSSPTLEHLLSRSDVVTLHTPLTQETHHLLNTERLAHMRPNAVLVNTCRGAVVDETALAEALMNGGIAGAAIDVFEHEPPLDSPLLTAPNVLLSPHIAGITIESAERTALHSVKEIERVLSGKAPRWCINPEVLKTRR